MLVEGRIPIVQHADPLIHVRECGKEGIVRIGEGVEDEEDGQVSKAELVADKELATGITEQGLDVAEKGGDEVNKDVADDVHLLLERVCPKDGQPFCVKIKFQLCLILILQKK